MAVLLRSRRDALRFGAAALLSCSEPSRAWAQARQLTHFERTLTIPPALKPSRRDDTTDYYELAQCESQVEIMPGVPTTMWTYGGSHPGPTIRATRGRRAVIRHENQLKTHTVVHLHGGVTAPESDGYPTEMVLPGMSGSYIYENQSRGATLWYHDHAMDHTARNIYMGLSGVYLIEDPEEAALGLPSGEFDIPLMIQDRAFMPDGSLHYHAGIGGMSGATGDTTLVNGSPWPRLEVSARKYRFRIVNASNATVYRLALSSGKPLVQIATDGGLLAEPVANRSLPLAMAERAEVVIDFSEYSVGTKVVLSNLNGKGPRRDVMRFDVVRREGDDSRLPSRLGPPETLDVRRSAQTRRFRFGPSVRMKSPKVSWTINGHGFLPETPLAQVREGDIEVWHLSNRTVGPFGMLHPVHVHMVSFQILERNGGAPRPWETGWKDTVSLNLNESVAVIMKFEPYRGRYLMHCHNLEHEDHSMMARYDVI